VKWASDRNVNSTKAKVLQLIWGLCPTDSVSALGPLWTTLLHTKTSWNKDRYNTETSV